MRKGITKKLSSFTIDKTPIERFDEIVPNNEKSLRVESFIKEFVENNPNKVKSLKYHYSFYQPEKRGQSFQNRTFRA